MDTIEQAVATKLATQGQRFNASTAHPASPLAGEVTTYEFDSVEVRYAAQFTALPPNVKPDNWLAALAGGNQKPIQVIYGAVIFKKDGQTQPFKEDFVKVTGKNSSARFLMNSLVNHFYAGTSKLRDSNTEFSSHKKVEGNNIIKDFTPPIRLIYFQRAFDEAQKLKAITLESLIGAVWAAQHSGTGLPDGQDEYQADLTTLVQAGEPTATSQ